MLNNIRNYLYSLDFALKGINFSQFAFLGIYIHFFPIYLQVKGFDREEISFIQTMIPLVQIIIVLFLGYISDVFNLKERLLHILTLGTFLFSLLYFPAESLLAIILINFFLSLFRGPIIPLVDSTTLEHISHHGGNYGRIRLWGSVGFVVGTGITGVLMDYFPVSMTLYLMSGFLLLMFFNSLTIPVKPKEKTIITLTEILKVLSHHKLALLIITGFLHMLTLAAYHTYFSLYITDIDYSKTHLSVAIFVAVMSEVVLLYYSKEVLAKYDTFLLLTTAFIATAIRWFLLGFFQEFGIILISQMIHALSFGLFFVASMSYINHHFKDRLRTTGITFFSVTVFGLSGVIGTIMSGQIAKYYSYNILFFYCGILSLLTIIISLYFKLRETRTIN